MPSTSRTHDTRGPVAPLSAGAPDPVHRYWHYLFVIAVLTMFLSILALLNGFLRFYNTAAYAPAQAGLSSSDIDAGYVAMFVVMGVSPIPDYVVVPVYGALCATGLFNPYVTFAICLAGDLLPVEYACGRLAARPLLLRGLSYLRMSEQSLEEAERWVVTHGNFSIFVSTFIPFFYSVVGLAAGTLKMKAGPFFAYSTAGFAMRLAFLEYVGFYGVFIFTASYDYSQRSLFALALGLSGLYVVVHLVRTLGPRTRRS